MKKRIADFARRLEEGDSAAQDKLISAGYVFLSAATVIVAVLLCSIAYMM